MLGCKQMVSCCGDQTASGAAPADNAMRPPVNNANPFGRQTVSCGGDWIEVELQ